MIVFTSRTGNVRYLVNELGLPSVKIEEGLNMDKPYFLFTYTDGLGDIPALVKDFLNSFKNNHYIKGVIASGNMNFGQHYCTSANKISDQYNVPIIRKIDLRGTTDDLSIIKNQYYKLIEVNGNK